MAKSKSSPKLQDAKLTAIDQRVASRLHLRQIEMDAFISRLDNAIDRLVGGVVSRVTKGLKKANTPHTRKEVVKKALKQFYSDVQDTIGKHFEDIAQEGHKIARHQFASSIPANWFKHILPFLESTGDIFDVATVTDETGPIVKGSLSDEDKEKLIQRVIFPPLSKKKVEEIVKAPNPATGDNWQQRIGKLSKLAKNPDAVASAIVSGMSQGESITKIRKRVSNHVQGVRSSAQRIARTEGRRVAEMAQRTMWDDMGDMVVGAQVIATLDQNTRPHHALRHGTIYWKDPDKATGGKNKRWDELPDLPDEPNCRCYASPVMAPPEEFLDDPALLADFQNAAGNQIPDPSAYDQWFGQANEKRRKLAVGVKKYDYVKKSLVSGDPQWTDFVDSDGKLLTLRQLQNESPKDRRQRKLDVQDLIDKRSEQIKEISRQGFELPKALTSLPKSKVSQPASEKTTKKKTTKKTTPTPKVPKFETLVDADQEILRAIDQTLGDLGSDQPLINQAWQNLPRGVDITLEEFKQKLLDLEKRGVISLQFKQGEDWEEYDMQDSEVKQGKKKVNALKLRLKPPSELPEEPPVPTPTTAPTPATLSPSLLSPPPPPNDQKYSLPTRSGGVTVNDLPDNDQRLAKDIAKPLLRFDKPILVSQLKTYAKESGTLKEFKARLEELEKRGVIAFDTAEGDKYDMELSEIKGRGVNAVRILMKPEDFVPSSAVPEPPLFRPPPPASPTVKLNPNVPVQKQVEQAVLDLYYDRFINEPMHARQDAVGGLEYVEETPGLPIEIYKVRRTIRQMYGEKAASPEVFDAAIRELKSKGKIDYFALSETGKFTDDQREDSMQDKIGFKLESHLEPPRNWKPGDPKPTIDDEKD